MHSQYSDDDSTGWTIRLFIPDEATYFSILRRVQTVSQSHPVSTGNKTAGA